MQIMFKFEGKNLKLAPNYTLMSLAAVRRFGKGQLPQLESDFFAQTVQIDHKYFFLGELGVNKCKCTSRVL